MADRELAPSPSNEILDVLVRQRQVLQDLTSLTAQVRDAVVAFLENQAQSIAGVSLDEEAVHLIESQRAYQAAARVVTSVDQMLDRLINGTGIVGR